MNNSPRINARPNGTPPPQNNTTIVNPLENFKLSNEKDLNNSTLSNNSRGNKNFTCTFENCEKVYKSKENLTLHYKNIHLKEKPYSCSYCGSQFSHRNGILTLNFKIIFLKSFNKNDLINENYKSENQQIIDCRSIQYILFYVINDNQYEIICFY
jgi:hypothetical protein